MKTRLVFHSRASSVTVPCSLPQRQNRLKISIRSSTLRSARLYTTRLLSPEPKQLLEPVVAGHRVTVEFRTLLASNRLHLVEDVDVAPQRRRRPHLLPVRRGPVLVQERHGLGQTSLRLEKERERLLTRLSHTPEQCRHLLGV